MIGPASEYAKMNVDLYGVPRDYLDTVNNDYVDITSLEMDAVTSYLKDGRPDPVSTLYNDVGLTAWPTN